MNNIGALDGIERGRPSSRSILLDRELFDLVNRLDAAHAAIGDALDDGSLEAITAAAWSARTTIRIAADIVSDLRDRR